VQYRGYRWQVVTLFCDAFLRPNEGSCKSINYGSGIALLIRRNTPLIAALSTLWQ
jgi:hypothetical protein